LRQTATAARAGRAALGGLVESRRDIGWPERAHSRELEFFMDISGLTTFFTAILDAAVKIAALVAAVAVAAAGFMYFGVVGHNQRAMDAAQNGVRAAFLGLAFVWGAKELINLVAGAAGQPGLK
jgi:hypothetical protein